MLLPGSVSKSAWRHGSAAAVAVSRRAQWHDTPDGRPQAELFCHTPAPLSICEPGLSALVHCYALSHFLPISKGSRRVPIIANGEYDHTTRHSGSNAEQTTIALRRAMLLYVGAVRL